MPRTDVSISILALAEKFFPPGPPPIVRAAHGALDVLGAMNADSGGTLAQAALPQKSAAAVRFGDRPVLRIRSGQIAPPVGDAEVTLSTAADPRTLPLPARWAAPALALWQELAPAAAGAAILLHSDVPVGAGQASSTATLAALAMAILPADSPPAPLAVAQAVAAAHVRSACGREPVEARIMSTLTSLYGRERPVLLRYSAQPYRLVGPVPLPADVRVLALDTGVRYDSGRGAALDEFRLAAIMGYRIIDTVYRDLGRAHTPLNGYLANTSPLLYRQYFRALLPRRMRGSDFVRTFGPLDAHGGTPAFDPAGIYRVRTAVDHLIAENEHAEQFLQAMEELADLTGGDSPKAKGERALILARAGRLLLASHHSYRLRLELSCREADWLVDRLMEAGPERGVFGARITRGGGGGTVAALFDRSGTATDVLLEVMRAYQQVTGLALGITEA